MWVEIGHFGFCKIISAHLFSLKSVNRFVTNRCDPPTYRNIAIYSNSEKDQIEAEVGLCVSTCSKQIDRLKNSVVAAQQHETTQGRPGISGQVSAHLHGMVSVSTLAWKQLNFTEDHMVWRYAGSCAGGKLAKNCSIL